MTRPRWACWMLLAAAAAGGSLADDRRVSEPPRSGPYVVLAADFHVHAFPGDGALPAWELEREASRRGLHAIVISNHNQTLAGRVFQRWTGQAGLPLLIPSQEVTTPRFHLVAAGITRTIDWRAGDRAMIDAIHAEGGVVIAAHPVGRYWRGTDAMLERLDGVEVAHPLTASLETGREELTAFFNRVRAVNPGVAPIGSSDFHMVAPLGTCRTHVFAESVSVQGVLDAIRARRTVAEDQDGVLYGNPQLMALVRETRAGLPPSYQRPALIGAALALLALVGLIVLA
jgi:predicted metal-dependent phosphoesterase TrpH